MEENVYIIIDTSSSMQPSLPFVKEKFLILLQVKANCNLMVLLVNELCHERPIDRTKLGEEY